MLNVGYKKQALKKCQDVREKYEKEYESTIEQSIKLHEDKEKAVIILKKVDDYIHSLSNKPKEIEKIASKVSLRRKAFEQEVEQLELEAKKADKIGKSVAGAGVMAGAGVAAFGPSAAMGIATTFGTASTGTAIATLSGIAQTNAALAWLGGGALTAGGGGMAAGQAFLAMAGPVGWAIGGTALIGSGLLANSQNKKIAVKAEAQTEEIMQEKQKLLKIKTKILLELNAIRELNAGVSKLSNSLIANQKNNYCRFTDDEKYMLMTLMNSAESLSKKIGEKIV